MLSDTIEDPTAADDTIVVTFALNEAGTAYCRVTRIDSTEGAAEMPINRILTADWSGVHGSGSVTIEMTKLENVVPSSTNRDDRDVPIVEAQQYDVFTSRASVSTTEKAAMVVNTPKITGVLTSQVPSMAACLRFFPCCS